MFEILSCAWARVDKERTKSIYPRYAMLIVRREEKRERRKHDEQIL